MPHQDHFVDACGFEEGLDVSHHGGLADRDETIHLSRHFIMMTMMCLIITHQGEVWLVKGEG